MVQLLYLVCEEWLMFAPNTPELNTLESQESGDGIYLLGGLKPSRCYERLHMNAVEGDQMSTISWTMKLYASVCLIFDHSHWFVLLILLRPERYFGDFSLSRRLPLPLSIFLLTQYFSGSLQHVSSLKSVWKWMLWIFNPPPRAAVLIRSLSPRILSTAQIRLADMCFITTLCGYAAEVKRWLCSSWCGERERL